MCIFLLVDGGKCNRDNCMYKMWLLHVDEAQEKKKSSLLFLLKLFVALFLPVVQLFSPLLFYLLTNIVDLHVPALRRAFATCSFSGYWNTPIDPSSHACNLSLIDTNRFENDAQTKAKLFKAMHVQLCIALIFVLSVLTSTATCRHACWSYAGCQISAC